MSPNDQARLDQLLPAYLTHALAPDDRGWVEALLAADPAARAALAWHESVQRAIVENTDALPADVGLAKLMSRVAADRAAEAKVAMPPAGVRRAGPTLLERLDALFAKLFSPRMAAFATALIVLQAGVIVGLSMRGEPIDEPVTRSAAPTLLTQRALQVTFKSTATEREMRMLLTRLGARVADGPSQLGDYVLLVPAASLESTRRELELSGIVENVAAIDWRADGAKP